MARANIVQTTPNVICRLRVEMSLEDLRGLARAEGMDILQGRQQPLFCTVDGFDGDRRELWQIPEVIQLSKRVIESGLLSLMRPNIGDERNPAVWGAVDVWFCSEGHFAGTPVGGEVTLTPELLDQFEAALAASNQECDSLLASSARSGGSISAATVAAETTELRKRLYAAARGEIHKVLEQATSKQFQLSSLVVVISDRNDRDPQTEGMHELMRTSPATFVPSGTLSVNISAMLREPFAALIALHQPNVARILATEAISPDDVWVVVWAYGGAQLLKVPAARAVSAEWD